MSRELAYTRLAEVREAVEAAALYDRMVPPWLPLAAILLILLSIPASLATPPAHSAVHGRGGGHGFTLTVHTAFNAIATLFFLAGSILFLYTNYLLIKRRDDHFTRSHTLYQRIVELLDTLQLGDPELPVIRSKVEEMREREHPRGPVLWTIVVLLVSILWLYVAHFLTRDFEEHEERERTILSNLKRILERRGIPFAIPPRTIPRRNTVLYAIASLATLGLFTVYWMYVLASDPNNHLTAHRLYEKRLLEALEKLVEKA